MTTTPETKAERTQAQGQGQYETELDQQIEKLVDWIIDKRGWSRLNCAGEASFNVKRYYEEISHRVSKA